MSSSSKQRSDGKCGPAAGTTRRGREEARRPAARGTAADGSLDSSGPRSSGTGAWAVAARPGHVRSCAVRRSRRGTVLPVRRGAAAPAGRLRAAGGWLGRAARVEETRHPADRSNSAAPNSCSVTAGTAGGVTCPVVACGTHARGSGTGDVAGLGTPSHAEGDDGNAAMAELGRRKVREGLGPVRPRSSGTRGPRALMRGRMAPDGVDSRRTWSGAGPRRWRAHARTDRKGETAVMRCTAGHRRLGALVRGREH